jgi:hypothetical protein
MIGFIVVAHWSDDLRPYGNIFLQRHLQSIYDSCEHPFKIYVIDNQSQYRFELDKFDNISYTYIEDQSISGITGAWNLGISKAFEDGCDVIINGGDDMFYNQTVNTLINFAINDTKSINRVYAPLSNGVTTIQLSDKPKRGHIVLSCCNWNNLISGFLFLFTKEHYDKFKISETEYFSLTNIPWPEGKWHGQEQQWIENSKNGLEAVVVCECWLAHEKQRGWVKLRNI